MLRIVLSRAALFPCVGLALMAAGAMFPDGNTAGIILIVVGASVAFYSLRAFSENFAWGADSRSMLTLCGVAFVIGLALLLSSTRLESDEKQVRHAVQTFYDTFNSHDWTVGVNCRTHLSTCSAFGDGICPRL
jgi:hypothetical protein